MMGRSGGAQEFKRPRGELSWEALQPTCEYPRKSRFGCWSTAVPLLRQTMSGSWCYNCQNGCCPINRKDIVLGTGPSGVSAVH